MAISGEPIAVEILRVRSQQIADALLANASDRIAPVSGLAELTVGALRVEETLEAVARVWVAVCGVVVVPVVAAVAGDAGAARDFRVTVVVVGANGAT